MPSKNNIKYLEDTKEKMQSGKAFYFTDFSGVSVQNLEKLRIELKKSKGNYLVVKNTLGTLVMKKLGFTDEMIGNMFIGPTGIAIAFDDPIILAKILNGSKNIKIKGSIIEGVFYNTEDVIRFSKLPSKEGLYAQVAGSLNILGNLVGALEGMMRNLIYTLISIKEKRDEKK
ncbi:50S ribosomal protein L10 [candidate division WOR-3 bacterium RBG_13_43_14]|uniref:50S ribosomal protein L10 n=1 Tax=candidate division WOR-3 bacterium RBG_13_43_14 TaxID=1802590 RepID=A0A1F4UG42_UNCW3|nr:MAG: 50S ribosomal protein L10 [candidate division WOR-3 bacterium RBG_13_43_14]